MASELDSTSSWQLPPGLTPKQIEAVMAPDRGLCVLAGAGTGKTRVLTLRVARRVHDRTIAPAQSLVCTFGRKAADELGKRLWLLGVRDGVRTDTFHSLALRIIRHHRMDRGRSLPVLLDDRRRLLRELLSEQGTSAKVVSSNADRIETEIGWAKARLIAPDAYEEEARSHGRRPPGGAAQTAANFARYEQERSKRGVLDFDDLLWLAADILADDRQFGDAMRWRHRHVFVDEMQDVNPAQFRLLRQLLADDPDICVVGDPRQSIYGWNGADPSLLNRMPELFPGIRVLHLDENHRCTPQVVQIATSILKDPSATQGGSPDEDGHEPTSSRSDGSVPRFVEHPDDVTEATWVAHEAWRTHRPGRPWARTAVLARTNAQLSPIAAALRREKIPFLLVEPDRQMARTARQPTVTGNATPYAEAEDSLSMSDDGGDDGQPDDLNADGVTLTTFHRAKGLQWSTVFVVGVAEGLVPHRSARSAAALEEERRLLYVALTRAEDDLTCTWAVAASSALENGTDQGERRTPSRWWPAMVAAREALANASNTVDRSIASAQLKAIRDSLTSPSESHDR